MKCPDERVWFDVVGGTIVPEDGMRYIQHASTCDECGQRLKAATRIFGDNLSPAEEQLLNSLPSMRPHAQLKLAETASQSGDAPSKSELQSTVIMPVRKSFSRRITYVLAAAATIVFATFLTTGPATVYLLAKGYTQQGTLEYRIPYAAPPKEGTRGASPQEGERPAALLAAELLIRARLAIHSDDPHWLGKKGLLELLEGKSLAVATLQKA